jgi:hypothetical protein
LVVVETDTVRKPYAMVIVPGNAALAIAAMFTPRWFEEVTCRATVSRLKYDLVIRVALHLLVVVLWSNK